MIHTCVIKKKKGGGAPCYNSFFINVSLGHNRFERNFHRSCDLARIVRVSEFIVVS